MKFHVNKWNQRDKEFTMLVLTEEDIENESDKFAGAGYEILILPSKYKDVSSKYLDVVKLQLLARCGEIIYI